MPTKVHLSADEQITRGIEQLALGWNFINNPQNAKKKVPIDSIMDLIIRAYSYYSEDKKSQEKAIRSFRNYREKLEEPPFKIKMDFQKKIIQNYKGKEKVIEDLCAVYLEKYAEDYSYLLLDKFLKIVKSDGKLENALYYFVFFNLAARLGIKVEFTYDNILDGSKKSKRRVIPIALTCRHPYINLVAKDLKDNQYKHFILSCIEEIHTDILEVYKYQDNEKLEVNLKEFKETKEYRFNRKVETYTIQLNKKYLKHFRHVYFPEFKKISEANEFIILEVSTWDYRSLFQALFNYREDCIFLSPSHKVKQYKNILKEILKQY